MRVNDYHRIYSIIVDNNKARRQTMEPKIIKEESVERDSSVLDEPSALNNNNNKESAFRIHTHSDCNGDFGILSKSKIKSAKDAGFSSTSTSDSSGEHLLSPTQPVPIQHDVESESSSPPSDTFRNHSKLKRFLTTLVQFSGQVSPQTSERVKGQIFTLVSNLISVEEFHHNIQEMTNFPLRPFVLPFLRSHLPSLQRDLLTMARNNKQTLNQFLKQHENAYLDRDSQPSEPSEIFHQVDRPAAAPRDIGGGGGGNKRPYPLSAAMTVAESYYEAAGGYAADLDGYQQPCAKRPNLGYGIPFMYHHHQQHLLHHPGLATEPPPPPTVSLQPPPPPPPPPPSQHGALSHPYNMLPLLHIRETEDHKGHVEDEWKNIHVMLNCILSMVEKTKKALGILQERGMTDSNFPDWNRKKSTEEVLAQTVRHTEERIESIKKKAEDSMNEIRHQAMVELQKLVLAAENKIIDLVAAERTKINGNRTSGACTVGLHRASPPLIPQYNSCWNCGRKANETCSGCNAAQYCGSFCQHKDWETHHQTCCAARSAAASPVGKKPPQPPPTVSAGIVAAPSAAAASPSVDVADDLSTNRPDACSTAAAASDPAAAATSAADKVQQPYGNKQQQQQLLSLQQSSNNNNNSSTSAAAAGKHR